MTVEATAGAPEESLVSTSPEPRPLEPIRASERIAAIDILRGLALFGIIAANIRGFAGPAITYFEPHPMWPGFADRLVQAFIDAFIQGKFIAIFSFLFGVGFAVQLSRAEARGGAFGSTYARRLFVLLAIGLVHGLLIWWGDILVPYALGGFLLLFFRKRSNRTILSWGIALYVIPVLLVVVISILPVITGAPIPSPPPPTAADLQEIVATYGSGSWFEIHLQRVTEAFTFNWGYIPFFLPQLLGLFLFGVLAWRKQIFTPSPESLPRYRLAMILGLTFGIAGNVVAVITRWHSPEPMFPPTLTMLPVTLLQTVANPALSIGYVSLVIMLCQSERWRARLASAGAVGRTALSNYLLQSVLGTLLFYGYGFGLYGMGPALLLIPTFVIYAIELWLSRWWLQRWRFGPVEWLWRSLTYRKTQPMVRSEAVKESSVPLAGSACGSSSRNEEESRWFLGDDE